MAAGGVWLLVSDRRARAHDQRIADIVLAYAPPAAPVVDLAPPLAEREGKAGLFARVLAILAIDTDRPDLYPMPLVGDRAPHRRRSRSRSTGSAGSFSGRSSGSRLPLVWFLIARAIFGIFRDAGAQPSCTCSCPTRCR